MNHNKLPVNGRHIQWMTDLVRLQIVLWDRIDQMLVAKHGVPLSSFEALYIIGNTAEHRLQVGELSRALGVTVGGTSKIIDRLERTGFIDREADPTDRRATQVVLTALGERTALEAAETYEAVMASFLNVALNMDEQRQFHEMVMRCLAKINSGASESGAK